MRCAGLLLIAGCNQVYGLDHTQVRDAAASLEPPVCSTVQFSPPLELSLQFADNDDAEYDPQLSSDGLEIWYASNTTETHMRFLLFHGTRASTDAPFEIALVDLANANQYHNGEPALTADGKRMLFKVEDSPTRIFEGIRDDPHQFPFDQIVAVNGFAEFSSTGVQAFDLTWDGLRMYFVVRGGQLWFGSRADRNQPFGNFVDLGLRNVHFPTISGDELELFYTPFNAVGDVHALYRRERANVMSPFGPESLVLDEGGDPDITPTSSQMIVARDHSLSILQRSCD